MTDEEFDNYMDPTIALAKGLTSRAKEVLRNRGPQDALAFAETAVLDLTEAQRVQMLALAITLVAQMEMEQGVL